MLVNRREAMYRRTPRQGRGNEDHPVFMTLRLSRRANSTKKRTTAAALTDTPDDMAMHFVSTTCMAISLRLAINVTASFKDD